MKKRVILGIVGLLIGAAALYWSASKIDFAQMFSYIRRINAWWVLLIFAVYSFAFIARSIRWKYFLAHITEAKPQKLFNLLIIGFFVNNVFPARVGEVVRAYVSGKKLNISKSGVLATIVVERLFDGLAYITFFVVTVSFLPFPDYIKTMFWIGAAMFTGILVLLFLLARHRAKAANIFSRLPLPGRIRGTVEHVFLNFVEGLQMFSDHKTLLKGFFFSIFVWGIEGLVFFIMSFPFNLCINYFQSLFVMIIIGMASILPGAPGYVGSVEASGMVALNVFHIDKNLAMAYILTIHSLQWLTVAVWGIRGIIIEKITLPELIHIEKQK
jgi:glycosyltransferase 2 family protein